MRSRRWWERVVIVIGDRLWFATGPLGRTAVRLHIRWTVHLAGTWTCLWLPRHLFVVQPQDVLFIGHTGAGSNTFDVGAVSCTHSCIVGRAAVRLNPGRAVCLTMARAGERGKKALHGARLPSIWRTIGSQTSDDSPPNLTADRIATRGTTFTSVRAEGAQGASAAVDDVIPIDMAHKDFVPPGCIFEDDVRHRFLNLVLQQISDLLHLAQVDGRTWDDVRNRLDCRICCFSSQGRDREENQRCRRDKQQSQICSGRHCGKERDYSV